MRGERGLLRLSEYLIRCACRRLPAATRDERFREWTAELPAILSDPAVRLRWHRAARMLRFAAGNRAGSTSLTRRDKGRRLVGRKRHLLRPGSVRLRDQGDGARTRRLGPLPAGEHAIRSDGYAGRSLPAQLPAALKLADATRRGRGQRHRRGQSTQRQKGCPAGSRNTRKDVPGWCSCLVAPSSSTDASASSRSSTITSRCICCGTS